MKVRLRYAKRGRLRFSSHRTSNGPSNALRRRGADGLFGRIRPHPKISPCECRSHRWPAKPSDIEIGLAARFDVDQLRADLTRGHANRLDIVDAVEVRRAISSVGWRPAWQFVPTPR